MPKLIYLYKEETPPPEQVSNFMFRKVFIEQFNLSDLDSQRKLHLLTAESARNNYKIDKNRGADDYNLTVIVFDLMKTLTTPVISTGICYYKIQLWTYCLGIHNANNDEVTMYGMKL